MSYQEMQALIHQKVYLHVQFGLCMTCDVKDVKQAYGKLRVLIAPVSGCGQAWVDASRVRPLTKEAN
jgi:hypothetical protein